MHKVKIKPLSVNSAWKGKRFRSNEYKTYDKIMSLILPSKIDIPDGELAIIFIWYFSSAGSDYDNPIKPTQDIICKKYGINDNRFKAGFQVKEKVKKGEERLEFKIIRFNQLKISWQ